MRQLILQRIEDIKKEHNGFDKGLMRWREFLIFGKSIQTLDFNTFNDEELLVAYEKVLRRHYIQM